MMPRTPWPLPSATCKARRSGLELAHRPATGRLAGERDRHRLDEALVERGLAENRSRARALIMAADVLVNGAIVTRAGASVRSADDVSIKAPPRFVSRGGEKLDHALTVFGIEVHDLVAADFGASTGGFTDCLLQRGASRVYAIDVGYGQLHPKLRNDPRVVVMERVNARTLGADALPEAMQWIVIDASFIGLGKLLPAAHALLAPGGFVVALVKPQFEVGKANIAKGGVVRDEAARSEAIARVCGEAEAL